MFTHTKLCANVCVFSSKLIHMIDVVVDDIYTHVHKADV